MTVSQNHNSSQSQKERTRYIFARVLSLICILCNIKLRRHAIQSINKTFRTPSPHLSVYQLKCHSHCISCERMFLIWALAISLVLLLGPALGTNTSASGLGFQSGSSPPISRSHIRAVKGAPPHTRSLVSASIRVSSHPFQ